ncbi:coiled-coil alpha-helical rod protein 1-like [Strigops habroptila]|uniref:coiled-coil alpha-helical rod protein 1-like n=1 Tax=Strigops habroptila TaxID=2489341 RepID=UPI0011CF6FC4|nr:coiled-coil alpha-helical rod protein 1-like [Strigops habroptila]
MPVNAGLSMISRVNRYRETDHGARGSDVRRHKYRGRHSKPPGAEQQCLKSSPSNSRECRIGAGNLPHNSGVVRAYRRWSTPLNLTPDSAYVAGIVMRVEASKEASGGFRRKTYALSVNPYHNHPGSIHSLYPPTAKSRLSIGQRGGGISAPPPLIGLCFPAAALEGRALRSAVRADWRSGREGGQRRRSVPGVHRAAVGILGAPVEGYREVPPMAEQPPGTGLIPPSHFMLPPPEPSTSRPLGAELEAERRRGQALGAELEAERRRGQALEAELEAERRRGQALEAELEAERRRGQALEAELEAERRRGQALEAELEAERRRGQALEVELEAERRRGQALEAELEAERRRGQGQGAEPVEGQPLEGQAQLLLQARLSAMGHILALQEKELSRELPPPGVPVAMAPPRLRLLLGCWREKVFRLLLQLRVQEELQRVLRAQVGTLGAAVAAGTRRVARLELSLRERTGRAEEQRLQSQRLAQEVTQQRGRAEAAEEALGELARAAARLAGVVAAHEAAVAAATRTMGTLSTRLRRAGQRLRVLQGLVAPVVALDHPRWLQDPAGDNPVAEVTGSIQSLMGTVAKVRRGVVALEEVTRDEVTPDEATLREDRMGPPPSRAALSSLVTQLQALGATILGDNVDPP